MKGVPAELYAAATRAAGRARRSGRPAWLLWRRDAAPEAAPPDPWAAEAFRFASPAHGFAIAAAGAAAAVESAGEERFAELRAGVARVASALECVDQAVGARAHPRCQALWVGGFAFAPEPDGEPWEAFPPARLVLPARIHARDGDVAVEQRAVQVQPGERVSRVLENLLAPLPDASPPVAACASPAAAEASACDDAAHLWRIRRALAAVRSGLLEKVVVAREHVLRAAGARVPDAVFEVLANRHPTCRSFLVRRGDSAFVGASPERLVRVARGHVRADALAGSRPRGATPGRDAQLARDLLESKKEQEEHAVVVRALRDALEPLCRDLVVPEAPRVRALAGIQHLHTPVAGRMHADVDLPLLRLAERVHPTPAVAGAPRAAALRWLRSHEDLERGWYAGGVGWMDGAGEGELFVALRSALLRDGEAHLFAGAGIVADSDAAAELGETELKLRAMRDALEACG